MASQFHADLECHESRVSHVRTWVFSIGNVPDGNIFFCWNQSYARPVFGVSMSRPTPWESKSPWISLPSSFPKSTLLTVWHSTRSTSMIVWICSKSVTHHVITTGGDKSRTALPEERLNPPSSHGSATGDWNAQEIVTYRWATLWARRRKASFSSASLYARDTPNITPVWCTWCTGPVALSLSLPGNLRVLSLRLRLRTSIPIVTSTGCHSVTSWNNGSYGVLYMNSVSGTDIKIHYLNILTLLFFL